MGTQMESAVLGWFMLTLTDSPFLVGAIAGARMAMNFLAIFAGAVIDLLPRNWILATVEFVMGSMGFLMLALILTGWLEVWHIFAITLVMGTIRLFQMPTAQSLVGDTLPAERLSNGAAFNTIAMNLAMLVGPVVGGVLFKAFGPQGAYLAIASLYLVSGLMATGIGRTQARRAPSTESVIATVGHGLRYALGNQVIWAVLAIAVIINLAGWTLHTSLAPIFARDVLGTDSVGLGLMLFAFGSGALVGSMSWAMVPSIRNAGRLLIVAVFMWHATHPALLTVPLVLPVPGDPGDRRRILRIHPSPDPHPSAPGHPGRIPRPGHESALLRHPGLQLRHPGRRRVGRHVGSARRRPGCRRHRHHAAGDPGGAGPQTPPGLTGKCPLPCGAEHPPPGGEG